MMRDKPNLSQRPFECQTCEHFEVAASDIK
jgi:hypothetical protein